MTDKPTWAEIPLHHPREAVPVRIVGDGAISTAGVGDGRMLPVLILDTTERPDIIEYIRLHQHGSSGDVKVQWAQMPDHLDTQMLLLKVLRPAELNILIAFDLHRNHGFLIEQILGMNGLYLQAGEDGDRMGNTMDHPRILVEVPDTGFRRNWDRLYFQFTVKKLRGMGLDRKQAKVGARDAIAKLREIGAFRMPSRSAGAREPDGS